MGLGDNTTSTAYWYISTVTGTLLHEPTYEKRDFQIMNQDIIEVANYIWHNQGLTSCSEKAESAYLHTTEGKIL